MRLRREQKHSSDFSKIGQRERFARFWKNPWITKVWRQCRVNNYCYSNSYSLSKQWSETVGIHEVEMKCKINDMTGQVRRHKFHGDPARFEIVAEYIADHFLS